MRGGPEKGRDAQPPGRERLRGTPTALAALALLTLAGLWLRLEVAGQSLFGDELFTYPIVTAPDLHDVFAGIHRSENTPPLYYVLAWLAAKLGDDPGLTRAPSVVYATAAIPMLYLLGTRVAGRGAGLMAAALLALSPFAIFFGTQARAYAGLLLLLPLATYALLRASREGGLRWWALLWLAATAAIYTHYTAVFVLAAQAVWLFARVPARRRPILLTHAAVAVAYLPWLRYVTPNDEIFVRADPNHFSLEPILRALGGHPLAPWDADPGVAGVVLIGLGVLVAAAGLGVRSLRGRALPGAPDPQRGPAPDGGAWRAGLPLLAALTLATPIGLLIYGKLGSPIFNGRNLIAALPFALLLGSAVLMRAPRRLAAIAAALLIAGFAAGSFRAIDESNRRPALKEAGEIAGAEAGPHTAVLELTIGSLLGARADPPFTSLKSHPLYRDLAIYLDPGVELHNVYPRGSEAAWRSAKKVIVIAPSNGFLNSHLAAAARRRGGTLERSIVLDGLIPIRLSIYRTTAAQATPKSGRSSSKVRKPADY